MTKYKDGLSTEAHNKIDVKSYYERVHNAVVEHKGGTIVDIFSGGPRDILTFHTLLDGDGQFLAIDYDTARLHDLTSMGEYFNAVETVQDLAETFKENKVGALQHRFPEALPFEIKADFVLCNAGLMFVSHDDMPKTIKRISEMMNENGGELVLRFSQEREDKKEAEAKGRYFVHGVNDVLYQLRANKFFAEHLPNLKDPMGRPFEWIDIKATRWAKGLFF